MYGFEHDLGPDEDYRLPTPGTSRELVVLIGPAVIMLAGFTIAVFVR